MPKVAKRDPYIPVEDFVDKYGEVMRQCDVAKMLNYNRSTVCVMCADGRLDTAPDNRVLVRSVHAYLYTPRGLRLIKSAR